MKKITVEELKDLTSNIVLEKCGKKDSKEWLQRFQQWATILSEIGDVLSAGYYRLGLELSHEHKTEKIKEGKSKRISKNPYGECFVEANAVQEIQKAFNEFKSRRKFNKFIKIAPLCFTGKWGRIFKEFVDQMESFRCNVLAMPPNRFYTLLSEFLLTPNERTYYPIKSIIGDDPLNSIHADWLKRIETVMCWISDVVLNREVDVVQKFLIDLGKLKIHVKDMTFMGKSWCCAHAVLLFGRKKGWSYEVLLSKIEIYMRRKQKKRTTEMLLTDVVHGDLNTLEKGVEVPKKKKKETSDDIIKEQDWYEGWKAGLQNDNFKRVS